MKKYILLVMLAIGLAPGFEKGELTLTAGSRVYAQTVLNGVEVCGRRKETYVRQWGIVEEWEVCTEDFYCDGGETIDEPHDCYPDFRTGSDSGDECDPTSIAFNMNANCEIGDPGGGGSGGGGGGGGGGGSGGGGSGGGTGTTPCPTSTADLENVFTSAPTTTLEELKTLLNQYMDDFGIETKEELQHFLAQAGHETGGFDNLGVTENMNYSAEGLLTTWPSRFSRTDPSKEDPDEYANDPEKIGNYVYFRTELGNTNTDDGYKYRGRGIFQLTGKANYQEFQTFYNNEYNPDIDIISSPDLLVSDHTLSVVSALWFFEKKVLNKITVDSNTTVTDVTKKVNGGINGLPDREAKFNLAQTNIDCN